MKTAGIVLLVAGLIMTLYTGFTYITKEKVVNLGDIQITRDDEHAVHWQPYTGIGVMLIGGLVLIRGRKKRLAF